MGFSYYVLDEQDREQPTDPHQWGRWWTSNPERIYLCSTGWVGAVGGASGWVAVVTYFRGGVSRAMPRPWQTTAMFYPHAGAGEPLVVDGGLAVHASRAEAFTGHVRMVSDLGGPAGGA